ncbi:4542_t:CDS:2 [Paraglomus occultum]|uniref:4542_t:CDS:1 n=1 Tax=Paraglomus occultum TaxID=144539 RepID=A0A9N9B197_9GLOM|nr:4542_t:CDS:2 [Paraglomus occultum]
MRENVIGQSYAQYDFTHSHAFIPKKDIIVISCPRRIPLNTIINPYIIMNANVLATETTIDRLRCEIPTPPQSTILQTCGLSAENSENSENMRADTKPMACFEYDDFTFSEDDDDEDYDDWEGAATFPSLNEISTNDGNDSHQ